MKKRASSYLLVFLCVVLAGLMSYTVYASLTSSLAFSNTISFTASDDEVYYRVSCSVQYEGATDYIKKDVIIDHDGTNPDPESTDLIFTAEDFKFSKENNVIIYKIIITNYSSFDIIATLALPEFAVLGDNTEVVKNVISGNQENEKTIEAFDGSAGINNIIYDSVEFSIKSTCMNFTRSFANVSNDFGFSLEKVPALA